MNTRLSIYGLMLPSLLVLAGALPQRAQAAPMLSSSTFLCRSGEVGGVSDCRSTSGGSQTSDHWVTPATGYDALAESWAVFGVLKARAAVTLSNYPANSFPLNNLGQMYGVATAIASFTDELTISGGTGTGYLQPSFWVDGMVSQNSPLSHTACVELSAAAQGPAVYNDCTFNTGTVHSLITPNPFAFTFGTPFDLRVNFLTGIASSGYTLSVPYSASAEADFSHTVTLRDFLILDGNMQPLQGASLLAESGTLYALNSRNDSNVVPAPGSVLLLALGFTSLALTRRWI